MNKLIEGLPEDQRPECAVFVGGLNIVNDEKRLRRWGRRLQSGGPPAGGPFSLLTLADLCPSPPLSRLVHIVVGTPGRICALLQAGTLLPRTLSTLVLDEADTLLADAFYTDVTWVYDQLPKRKQVRGL